MKNKIATNFTSVNEALFLRACELGVLEALCLLVIAMGTTGVSDKTLWSAEAITKRLKVDWRYAKRALENLEKASIITNLKAEENKGKRRARPSYQMNEEDDQRIWYPNSLFEEFVNTNTGEVIPSPIVRVKGTQDVNLIRFIFYLYKHQDLKNEAGIPRGIIHSEMKRISLGEWKGQWEICRYEHSGSNTAPVISNDQYQDAIYQAIDESHEIASGKHWIWYYIKLSERLGFIERAVYLFEGDGYGTSYLYPVSGDLREEQAINVALTDYFTELLDRHPMPNEARDEPLGEIEHQIELGNEIFPIDELVHRKALLYEIFRIRFRANTESTGEWYGKIQRQSERLMQHFLA